MSFYTFLRFDLINSYRKWHNQSDTDLGTPSSVVNTNIYSLPIQKLRSFKFEHGMNWRKRWKGDIGLIKPNRDFNQPNLILEE